MFERWFKKSIAVTQAPIVDGSSVIFSSSTNNETKGDTEVAVVEETTTEIIIIDKEEEKDMSQHDDGHKKRGYYNFGPLPQARTTDVHEFDKYCCTDRDFAGELLDFVNDIKMGQPAIKQAFRQTTPNGCGTAIFVRWALDHPNPAQQVLDDRKAILLKYLELIDEII